MIEEIEYIKKELNLIPLPLEGGFYSETYQSKEYLSPSALSPDHMGKRKLYSCIYYLLTSGSFSKLHRLPGDEIFHFYKGDPVEMLNIFPNGSHSIICLGNNLVKGEIPQFRVEGKVWQGCRLKEGGSYALLGTSMSPGFDFDDYEHGIRKELTEQFPHLQNLIERYS